VSDQTIQEIMDMKGYGSSEVTKRSVNIHHHRQAYIERVELMIQILDKAIDELKQNPDAPRQTQELKKV
jgi:hypothetical protein